MFLKSKWFQLGVAVFIAVVVGLLPRPEGTKFKISGDPEQKLLAAVSQDFELDKTLKGGKYVVRVKEPGKWGRDIGEHLQKQAALFPDSGVIVDWVDGLSPKGKRFLCVLAVLVFLFVAEPIPLEITAILIGVLLVASGVMDTKSAWAPYMNPVVVFIMCCLIFAIALDKAGITKRLGFFIVRKAGTSVVRFTFIITVGLGFSSAFLHDAAACAIGIVTMLPLMKAAGIKPYSNTGKFMMLSLPFACSAGGMGSLIGGGRCMVSAAFLKEFTGIEITFADWMLYAMPAAIVCVPLAVLVVYFVYRPDHSIRLPAFDESMGPWTRMEKSTVIILGIAFLAWLTASLHGLHYSITGMVAVAFMILFGILKWDDIHENLEWGTALFIFGGGISLGLGMEASGAAEFFANLFLPYVKGGGWLLLFAGVGVFGALVTNAMANVAAAALILPIVIPMAVAQGVDPRILALCLGMSTSFAMLLVIGCPPNAIAYSYRYFKASDLTKAGAVATPVLLVALILVCSVWWGILGLTS
ncbi:MAG: DASS family sodium-coupled anion symporter [Proteobacteria bacterium]|nr:DASS family sodium-coupled anion symporter [Pseudomonadota bacterium]